MAFARKNTWQNVDRGLGCLISYTNWLVDLPGANLGPLIPSQAASGWSFGNGDLILFAEFATSATGVATIPTLVTPTGFSSFAGTTLVDQNGRGTRLALSYKIGVNADFNGSTRVKGMAVPVGTGYRAGAVRCCYMNRPIRSIVVGGGVAGANAAAVGPLTVLASALPANGYDFDCALMWQVGKADSNPTDAHFTVSPIKGTEYRTYPGLASAAVECGVDASFNNANVRHFTNWYTHGDPVANFSLTVADIPSAGQMVVGGYMKLK